jgi:hypothetical protein
MSRVCVVMQPHWLPYLGYFQLAAASDVFIFLDDVQFARRTWQCRNRILDHGQEVFLEARVKKLPLQTPICEIELDDSVAWRAQHLEQIRAAYAGRPGFSDGMALMEAHYGREIDGHLSALNRTLIEEVSRRCGLTTEFVLASDLSCGGRRSDHVVELCRAVGADLYFSPAGARDYIAEDGAFERAGLPVAFQSFMARPYPQAHDGEFVPYMSFVDALTNVGWDGLPALVACEKPA